MGSTWPDPNPPAGPPRPGLPIPPNPSSGAEPVESPVEVLSDPTDAEATPADSVDETADPTADPAADPAPDPSTDASTQIPVDVAPDPE
jgi:hypothetical protein